MSFPFSSLLTIASDFPPKSQEFWFKISLFYSLFAVLIAGFYFTLIWPNDVKKDCADRARTKYYPVDRSKSFTERQLDGFVDCLKFNRMEYKTGDAKYLIP